MEFKIEPGQIYGTRYSDFIFQVISVDDNYVTYKTRYPEHITKAQKMRTSFFIDMYDQEKYWLSWPLDLFHEYEWPRIQRRGKELLT